MNLEGYWWIPIIIAIVLISAGIYINNWEIQDSEVDSFINRASALEESAQNTRDVFDEKTTKEGLSSMIEEIPILGGTIKTLKFLTSIIDTLKAGFNLTIGFFQDVLSSDVLGIDGRIIALVVSGMVGAFGFAVYRSIKLGD